MKYVDEVISEPVVFKWKYKMDSLLILQAHCYVI